MRKCLRFEQLFAANRIREMVEDFYCEDATLEGPELSPRHGWDAIEDAFLDARASYRSIVINLDPVSVAGEIAFGGIANVNITNNGLREVHRGMMIWRRIGDAWFVQADFFFAQRDELGLAEPLYERDPIVTGDA